MTRKRESDTEPSRYMTFQEVARELQVSVESIRDRQRPYVDVFRPAAPVLDIGCGRGELIGLLRDAGVEARGIDADADMAAYARVSCGRVTIRVFSTSERELYCFERRS